MLKFLFVELILTKLNRRNRRSLYAQISKNLSVTKNDVFMLLILFIHRYACSVFGAQRRRWLLFGNSLIF